MRRTAEIRINRMNPTSLAKQVAEGYTRLIESGRLKEGTVLPSRAALADDLGISEYAVRKGLDILVTEGLLVSRAGVGYTVVGKRPRSLFANVLMVTVSHYDSYSARIVERLIQQDLLRAGYGVSGLHLDDVSPTSLRLLKTALRARPDFVILHARVRGGSPVLRLLADTRIPYLQNGTPETLVQDYASAFEDLAAACRAGGVHSVAQFNFARHSPLDAAPILERAGLYVEQVDCGAASARTLEDVQRAGLAAMTARLRRGPLPDLLLFNDDYLTLGALSALLTSGVRIPEDVRLVTLVNRGFGPVFTKSLAGIVNDPTQWGRRFAADAIAWMRTGVSPKARPTVSFVPGETFPESFRLTDKRR